MSLISALPATALTDLMPALDTSAAFGLVERGGPVVVIIGLFSVVALAVTIAKAIQFTLAGVGSGRGIEPALQNWFSGQYDDAASRLARSSNPTGRVLSHAMSGLTSGQSEAHVREDTERLALRLLAELRRYLRVLEATSQLAPLLGLFGTVIGMMGAFQALQAAGAASDPAALAGGIWVALITTAVGLAVAMPASLVLYWFEGRIEREKTIMEDALTSLFTHRLVAQPAATSGPVVRFRNGASSASAAE